MNVITSEANVGYCIMGTFMNLDVVGDTKTKRLVWIGHLVRMDRGRAAKKIFESKAEGRRRMGRPRFRWLEDVGKDLWKIEIKK
jgi:hypothetical protein